MNVRKLPGNQVPGRFAVLSQKHPVAFHKLIERILQIYKYATFFFFVVLNTSCVIEEQHGKME